MGRSHLVSLGSTSWPLTWLYLTFGRATRGHVLDFWKSSKNKEIQKSSTSGTLAPCNASGPPMWLPMNVKSKTTRSISLHVLDFWDTRQNLPIQKSSTLHFDSNSMSLRSSVSSTPISHRFHASFTSGSLQFHCDQTLISLQALEQCFDFVGPV